ncbi:MAG: hypothetical protein ACYC6Y_13050 [Thermoguttaceae bacterium]
MRKRDAAASRCMLENRSTMSTFCRIDDKHVPIYRILWISAVPHFCGSDVCQREGAYEVRLEEGETLWATAEEQAAALHAVEVWHGEEDELLDEGE